MSDDVPLTLVDRALVRMRPGPAAPTADPVDVVGEYLRHWLRADDPEVQLSGSDVVVWPDKLSAPGSALVGSHLVQGAALYCYPDVDAADVRPVVSTLGGQVAFAGAGSNYRMRWDFASSPIPATFRPYFWLVAQCDDPTVDGWALEVYSLGLAQPVWRFGVQGGSFVSVAYPGGVAETIVGPTADKAPHLVEYGFLPIVGNRLVVDGIGFAGAGSGALAWLADGYELLNQHGTDAPFVGRVAELLAAERVPCADRLLELRGSYFAPRYGIDISLSGVPASYGVDTFADKNLPCLATTVDNSLACAQGITYTPLRKANGGYVTAIVNDVEIPVSGDKLGYCYFSGDNGATARALNQIVAGDKLYWNGSVAGFQLETTDRLSLHYAV